MRHDSQPPRQFTQYLIDQGHSRIACIAGPLDKTPARLRLEGYHAAMARCGLPVAEGYVVTSDFEFGGGFNGTGRFGDFSGYQGRDQ